MALKVNPKKNGPSGFKTYFKRSSAPPKRHPTAGPNKNSTMRFGGALDLLKYVLKPDGPFFFGFTFNAMLSGLIYGTLLYRRPVSIKRIVIAEFFVKLVINCGLNTLWISMLYGKGFIALLGPRVIKNVIMLPIDSFILFFALTYAKKIAAQFGFFTVKSGVKERA